MSIPLLLITDFQQLFNGNTNGKGQSVITDVVDSSGKRVTDSWVARTPVTDSDYIAHLEGRIGLGISPITTKNKCVFGVIDVDIYKGDVSQYLDIIWNNNFPLVPFYSKSGGLHLYLFFSEEVEAEQVINLLQTYRKALGLPRDTEVFPKQKTIPLDGIGNWINLPYFNAQEDTKARKLPLADGRIATFEEAIDFAKRSRKLAADIEKMTREIPLFDAPPCLQSIYLNRDTAYRNEYLFSLARYFKAKLGDDFEFAVLEANDKLKRPMDVQEVTRSVLMSHKKKDYSYKCSAPPICTLCDKDECKRREYGIGADLVSELSYEELIQYSSDPPWYEWVVNGVALQFFNESDIIFQQKFRELCFRKLHILPYRLKEVVWNKIVNNALQNVTVRDVAVEDDISAGRLFIEYVAEFMAGRVMADNKEQVLANRVYLDKDKNMYVFKAVALVEYLQTTKSFRTFSSVEIQSKLKLLGGGPTRFYIDKSTRCIRAWQLPVEAIANVRDTGVGEVLIDFMDKDRPEEKF